MRLRRVQATRYVTPLREGGSLPAIVEGDDAGLYVLKFRGAGQGPKVLIAELICGELARALGLPVPDIVLMDLDPDLARTEPDPEIQQLIRASGGLNLALDYLPGSVTFDPIADAIDASLASRIVWFDAYVTNIDRTPRNANLLIWHRQPWLIDHGAALYFHHGWHAGADRSADAFPAIRDHVLLRFASELRAADETLAAQVTPVLVANVVASIPDDWLLVDVAFSNPDAARAAYVQHLTRRLAAPRKFAEEAIRARDALV